MTEDRTHYRWPSCWRKPEMATSCAALPKVVVQLLMETDVGGMIGAGRHERTGDRQTYRNGYLDRTLDTRLGSLQLPIPKLRPPSSRRLAVAVADATYLKQREGGRIVALAAIIAVAANTKGRWEVVGLHIGPSEAERPHRRPAPRQVAKPGAFIDDSEADVLAHMDFPVQHRTQPAGAAEQGGQTPGPTSSASSPTRAPSSA